MNNYFGLMGQINTMNSKDMTGILNLPPLCFSRVIEATLEAKMTTNSGASFAVYNLNWRLNCILLQACYNQKLT